MLWEAAPHLKNSKHQIFKGKTGSAWPTVTVHCCLVVEATHSIALFWYPKPQVVLLQPLFPAAGFYCSLLSPP